MEENKYVTCDECELHRKNICLYMKKYVDEGDHAGNVALLNEVAQLRKDMNSNFFKMFLAIIGLIGTFLIGVLTGSV